MILLDTNILLWLSAEPQRVGRQALARIESGLAGGEHSVSAITFWETAMLIGKGRYRLFRPLLDWRLELLSRGLHEIPVDGAIAADAGALDWSHGDPADRIILATAMRLGLTLVTADRAILAWPGPIKVLDGRA